MSKIVVDGQIIDRSDFIFRKDGRIITSIRHVDNIYTGEKIAVIHTAPPISHLPHAWTERAAH